MYYYILNRVLLRTDVRVCECANVRMYGCTGVRARQYWQNRSITIISVLHINRMSDTSIIETSNR
jgi:hypothetical protein